MAKRLPALALDENKHIICSVEIAAKQLGITRASLDRSINDLDIKKENARVDLSEVISKRNARTLQDKPITDSARKLKAEADYKSEKAKQEEMVTLQMMGELIPEEEVKDALTTLFLDIRQQLLLLPETIKAKVYSMDPAIAQSVGEVANETVQELLKRLAVGNGKPTDSGQVGKKPKRHYKKGAKSISSAASGNSK